MNSEQIRDLSETGDYDTLYRMWLDTSPYTDARSATKIPLSVAAKLRLIEWGVIRAIDAAYANGRLSRFGGRAQSEAPSIAETGIPPKWAQDIRRNLNPATVSFERMVLACDEGTIDGNLSRRGMRRRLHGEDVFTAASDRPKELHKTHRMKPDRVIQTTVETLRGLCDGIEMLDADDYDALDPTLVPEWAAEIYECRRIVGKLHKELNARVRD